MAEPGVPELEREGSAALDVRLHAGVPRVSEIAGSSRDIDAVAPAARLRLPQLRPAGRLIDRLMQEAPTLSAEIK